jgi:alpha-glucosidase
MGSDKKWWQDGVIYQIYPRSFSDSNGDGIGDLEGIRQKLDYIQELGVDAIWLSPIYPSPDVDFGYDVSNYVDIDPKYGTLADFNALVADAHTRGIRVILDLVLNHTSDQHPWFVESKKSKDNPYSDWYMWLPPRKDGSVPNGWESIFGGKGWEYIPDREEYYFHMFYKEQPDLNWRNPAVEEAIYDVFRFWMKQGADGFRLDVFNGYFKDAKHRDNPPKLGLRGFDRQQHVYDCDQPELIPVLKNIRKIVDENPDGYTVGETFLSTPEKAAKYCAPGLLHAAFNFGYLECKWNPKAFATVIHKWEDVLQEGSWPTYVLNNHDVRRTGTRFTKGEDDRILKNAAVLLLTMRGTPFMYYGEEIGMRDIPIKRSEIQDPIGKKYWPFHVGRDGCRSPMQWDESANAGFTSGKPWLPVHVNADLRTVKSQMADEQSLWHVYKQVLQLRKAYSVLRYGMFQPVTFEQKTLLAYLRQDNEQTILVIINFKKRRTRLALGSDLQRAGWKELLSTVENPDRFNDPGYIRVKGHEACILLRTQG